MHTETIPNGIEFDPDNYMDYRLRSLAQELIETCDVNEARVIWLEAFDFTADEMDTRK